MGRFNTYCTLFTKQAKGYHLPIASERGGNKSKMSSQVRNTRIRSPSSGLALSQGLVKQVMFGLVCFYLGLLAGMSTLNQPECPATVPKAPNCPVCPKVDSSLRRVEVQPKDDIAIKHDNGKSSSDDDSKSCNQTQIFPPTTDNFLVDFSTVPRDDFTSWMNLGIPIDDTKKGAEEVVVLYTSTASLPQASNDGHNHGLLSLSPEDALENCASVKVILQEPSKAKRVDGQCFALVPQWESYFVQKYMRLPQHGKLDMEAPLRFVGRSHMVNGNSQNVPDLHGQTNPFYNTLVEYLSNLDRLLADLKPKLEQALQQSANPDSKTFVVQVCNKGQAPLFHNFVCNAQAKGLDLSNVFMFATDEYTSQLSQDLGITAFYDEAIFGAMPEAAAGSYGDRIFSKMMMAKVYCVHLVLSLGYNVIFQDVDVVWHKNPIDYFQSEEAKEWDMMFQDDGARSFRYAPYSPNTGFYYVKHSPSTLFFYSMLLRSGDVIARFSSHQAALTALLNEHVSSRGLRIKVWKKGSTNPFPGGVEYHRFKDVMKNMLQDKPEVEPYLFHMSWTKNKDNKKLYFEQLGEWYVQESCDVQKEEEQHCCLAEPNIVCHYRDKPSKIPCKDSPPIDKGRPSFW